MELKNNPYAYDILAPYRGVKHGYKTYNSRIRTDADIMPKTTTRRSL